MKGITVWQLNDLLKSIATTAVEINHKYVPCRPIGWTSFSERIKAAWLVFTGKADVVVWPEGQ